MPQGIRGFESPPLRHFLMVVTEYPPFRFNERYGCFFSAFKNLLIGLGIAAVHNHNPDVLEQRDYKDVLLGFADQRGDHFSSNGSSQRPTPENGAVKGSGRLCLKLR